MSNSPHVCMAFYKLCELCIALGQAPANKHPECWVHQVNTLWAIAFNAHADPKPCSLGVTVQPFHCYVQFNGWPAGVFNPYGGQIAAGECANEAAFLEAMDAAIAKAQGGSA